MSCCFFVFVFVFFFVFCCWDTVFFGRCYSILQLKICCEKRKECHSRCFCCGLFLLSMFVRFLFVFDLLLILFTIVLWPSAGKELSRRLFTCVVLILNGCDCPFPVWCLGRDVELDLSVPDHCLFVCFSQSTHASLMDVLYTVHRLLLEHFIS